jgi:hypothetical protein
MSEKKATKSYINADGTEVRSASENAKELRFTFADKSVLSVSMDKMPEAVRTCATWHGLAQKIGDSYAGAKTVEEAVESAAALVERLEAGEWIGEREAAGPRISLILDSIVRVKANSGTPFTDAEIEQRRERLKTDKAYREAAMNTPLVKAAYAAILAEKAAERAKAAAEAAGAAGATPPDFSTL